MKPIIDFRVRPPQRDSEEDPRIVLDPNLQKYGDLYGMEEQNNIPFERLEADMSELGIRGVLQAEFEDQGRSKYWNTRVAELVGRRPDLFLGGVAGVDPRNSDALDELRWAHDELGLRGLIIQPAFLNILPTDPLVAPLYEFCREREVFVTIHTGINFSATGPIDLGRPLHIDKVACAFPGLPIVCNHGGWPWVMEAIAVAWKHPNVYLEFGAVAPKYLQHDNSGWKPIQHWMRNQLRSQVILGTDWPMLSYHRLLDELPLLDLPDEIEHAYTCGNALELVHGIWPEAKTELAI